MKTVNINASTNSKRIPIGRCEDNEATRVVFDCSGFSSAYGSGQATLLHRRSKEKISYIVQNITQEDNTVIWTVSSDDTAFSGEGTLQLMWTVNDVVVHSHFYTTITDPSLTDSSSEPIEVKSALQLLIDSCYTKEETDDLIAHMRAGSDWDANEGESGYIENRPFYTESGRLEKILDGVCNSPSSSATVPVLVDGSPYYYAFIDGEDYRVEYEGLSYDCTALRHPTSNMMMIGNGSVIGGEINAEYPFTIFSNSGNNQIIGSFNHAVTLSLSVGKPETVHKLDSKYLDGKLIASGTGENSEVFNDLSGNTASGQYSHSEGYGTTADGSWSHVEGYGTREYINYTGTGTTKSYPGASGFYSHVEGYNGKGAGSASHVEGYVCYSGYCGHAEGERTSSIGDAAHSEGYKTVANGNYSHSEGQNSVTSSEAICSHAEGCGTETRGKYSHSEGFNTIATADSSHVVGQYNTIDTDKKYVEIVGNGSGSGDRSNARTLDWNGNESLAGSLTLGMNTNDEITITPAQLAKLLYPFRENHWESNFMLPDGYISSSSSQVYTESEAASSSATNVYPVYYLPEEIDFDKLNSLDFKAAFFAQNTSILIHKNITYFNDTVSPMWMSDCRGISLNHSVFYIVRASDCYCNNEPYQFPSNVKTVIVMATGGSKPNLEHGVAVGSGFIQLASLDWTLK